MERMSHTPISTIIVRVLIKCEDSYLLVRKSSTSDRAGSWEFPGGHLEQDEPLEKAAKREVLEETGLILPELKYHHSGWYSYNKEQRMSVTFSANITSKTVSLSSEHDEYMWVNRSNYNIEELADHYRNTLDELFGSSSVLDKHKQVDDKSTTKYDHIIAYTDGGSRGNPGPSATGYVLMDEGENVIEEGGEYIGITTNNQAEYQAVKLALQQAAKFDPKQIDFFIDSLLVVNQMNGVFKIKNRDLWPIHEAIKELSTQYERVSYTHVRREYNSSADAQVNIVLDSYEHKQK